MTRFTLFEKENLGEQLVAPKPDQNKSFVFELGVLSSFVSFTNLESTIDK